MFEAKVISRVDHPVIIQLKVGDKIESKVVSPRESFPIEKISDLVSVPQGLKVQIIK